ncbi:YpfJ protein, zinc metalloprotease superfamily [Methylophaga frappieri]|uniref:YpfJ protein, zinc metalloprotease superfamily n=1 Tax=Methylophaga frappieri (strain ATCC BAA-2434 / DSM 25690 / JAM7) TaxID=754477 RepID=I1YF33_METFJ|nr:neutral zinc metallopeptidase [Methylophaga frappieri]AFJ01526.1 YpfJ protein, zinc metalloprotease superfamily [Methylophaga frappieri]
MRWRGNRRSSNIDNRRGQRMSGLSGAGGSGLIRLLPAVFKLLGFKGTLILIVGVVGFAAFTGNLQTLLSVIGMSAGPTSVQSEPYQETAAEKEQVDFVSVVLADTEDTWTALFKARDLTYQQPKLVLFRNAVQSACGLGQSAMGPFYCPADQQVYIDLSFYDQLKNQFKAPGDFAQAYVIAHEVGHHVQTLLGISQKVHSQRSRLSEVEGNKLSVKQELQADCFAGVWAHHADKERQLLEAGDIEEGLRAASAIGDDTLQKQSRGYVSPDSFTHGSSQQRVGWFTIGFESGDPDRCNTFQN